MKCRCLRWGLLLVGSSCFLLASDFLLLAETPLRKETEEERYLLPHKSSENSSWQPVIQDSTGYLDLDMWHTLLARQALTADPLLSSLNLGVRVQQRVAVLWGPVPNAALKQRAAEVLRRLPDLLEVRNELLIEEARTSRPEFLPEVLPPAGRLPKESESRRPNDARTSGLLLPATSSGRPLAWPAENIRLKPPPLGLPMAVSPSADTAREHLSEAIARLQHSQARWRDLQVQVQAGVVRLRGRVPCLQDAYEFARALAQLPEVERVLLDEVYPASLPAEK